MVGRPDGSLVRLLANSILFVCFWTLLQPCPANDRINFVTSDTDQGTEVPEVFLPAPRELLQELSRTEEALRNSQYSDAVFRLGNLLINPDTEDYFVPDRHRAGRIISLKADAQRILDSMKEPGKTSYELQFGSDAKHLLDKAVLAGDIHQISEVSRMFFHTHAGQLATFLLGRHHLDHGHPLASALTLQRLAQSTAARAQYDPALSLALAMAWLQAGNRHKAAKSLEYFQHFSTSLPADVPQLPQDLFGDVELALAWLDKQIVAHDRILSIDQTQWLIYQGDASRTGVSLGDVPLIVSDDPLVNCRWRVPVASDEAMENEILKKQRQYQLLNIPAMPRLYPLAFKNIILMRTPRYVFAVDAQTGNRLWRYDDFQSTLSNQAYSDLHGREFQNSGQNGPTSWHQRIWNDVPYGQMSCDGERLYFINKLGYSTSLRKLVLRNGIIDNPMGQKNHNELVALDLATQGKRQWIVGGESGENEPQMSAAFFLGAPLPIAGHLYALVEINGEVRLTVLDAATGQLQWKQPLIHTEETSGSIRVNTLRRMSGASPSFSNGVLVCPTSAGALVAVDIATRSLLWGFQYDVLHQRRGHIWPMHPRNSPPHQPGTRWTDPTPMIVGDRIILTPVESNSMYCLNLVDGKVLWQRSRDDYLYVGCVHQGTLLLVGKKQVTGIQLKNGREAWPVAVPIPNEGMPSGRGFYSGEHYFFPTSKRELIKVHIPTGELVEVMPTGNVLGNLISFQDSILSQGADHLTSFYQADVLRRVVERRLKINQQDGWALARQAQLFLREGQRREALVALRESFRLEPNDATRALLVDTLLHALQKDFATNEDLATEVEKLIDQPLQRTEYLRLMTIGLQQMGKRMAALKACVRLIDATTKHSVIETADSKLRVSRDRWIQVQLANIISGSFGRDRQAMDQLVEERMTVARRTGSSEGLREFLLHFGFHAQADTARLLLAERLLATDHFLEPEVLLIALGHSSQAHLASRADALLAQLYQNKRLDSLAARQFQHLKEKWTHVKCLEGKTGRELWQEARSDQNLKMASVTPVSWPQGKINVDYQDQVKQYSVSYQQFHPLDNFRAHGPGLKNITLAIDWKGFVTGRDRFGQERFRLTLLNSENRIGRVITSPLTEARAYGHLLIATHGNHLYAINTFADKQNIAERLLWHQSVLSVGDEGGPNKRIKSKQKVNRWGVKQHINAIRTKRGEIVIGRLGPLRPNNLCFQQNRSLKCVDPMSEDVKPIWTRDEIPLGVELFGDESLLFAIPPGKTEAQVIQIFDGQLLGPRRVPPEEDRWTTLGRHILASKQVRDNLSLFLFDPWYEENVWSRTFAIGSKATLLEQDEVAVLQPDGQFVLLAVADGSVRFESRLEPEEFLDAIHVIRSSREYILATTSTPTSSSRQANATITPAPNGTYSPLINGHVYAFDRQNGQHLWPVPAVIQGYGLPLDQPANSPLVLLMRHLHKPQRSSRTDHTSVLFLHKRDGRVVYQNDQLKGRTGIYSEIVDPKNHEVLVHLPNHHLRLKFTNDPVPPEPPAQTGTASSIATKHQGSLLKATTRGVGNATNPQRLETSKP